MLLLRAHCVNSTLKDLQDDQSELAVALKKMKTLMENTRLLFVNEDEGDWLWTDEIGLEDAVSIMTLRLANLATFVLALIADNDGLLTEANDMFLDIVAPDGIELSQAEYDLLLAIKCKLALVIARDPCPVASTVVAEPEPNADPAAQHAGQENTDNEMKPRQQQMADVMFGDLEDSLRQRQGSEELSASDSAFVEAVRARHVTLYEEIGEEDNVDYLTVKLEDYHDMMLGKLAAYLLSRGSTFLDEALRFGIVLPTTDEEMTEEGRQQNYNDGDIDLTTIDLTMDTEVPDGGVSAPIKVDDDSQELEDEGFEELEALIESQSKSFLATRLNQQWTPLSGNATLNKCFCVQDLCFDEKMTDMGGLVAHGAAALGQNGAPTPQHTNAGMAHLHQTPGTLPHGYQSIATAAPGASMTTTDGALGPGRPSLARSTPNEGGNGRGALPPNQSVPTTVLYEKARQAAMIKSTTVTRREGTNGSARRPWSPEEEKALMMGLDIVKGPHWSQILHLFGPNGTQSDILRDRSQVQLKDKARNLKLFFLKTNSEVPYYLQAVTGELKTRAPSQAARKEAEEKAREGQAKYDGTMALDSLRNHHATKAAGRLPQQRQKLEDSGGDSKVTVNTVGAHRPSELESSGLATIAQFNAQRSVLAQPQHPPLLPASARPTYTQPASHQQQQQQSPQSRPHLAPAPSAPSLVPIAPHTQSQSPLAAISRQPTPIAAAPAASTASSLWNAVNAPPSGAPSAGSVPTAPHSQHQQPRPLQPQQNSQSQPLSSQPLQPQTPQAQLSKAPQVQFPKTPQNHLPQQPSQLQIQQIQQTPDNQHKPAPATPATPASIAAPTIAPRPLMPLPQQPQQPTQQQQQQQQQQQRHSTIPPSPNPTSTPTPPPLQMAPHQTPTQDSNAVEARLLQSLRSVS